MVVNFRIEVSDELRKCIRIRYGKRGVATRREVKEEIVATLTALWGDIIFDARHPGERDESEKDEEESE